MNSFNHWKFHSQFSSVITDLELQFVCQNAYSTQKKQHFIFSLGVLNEVMPVVVVVVSWLWILGTTLNGTLLPSRVITWHDHMIFTWEWHNTCSVALPMGIESHNFSCPQCDWSVPGHEAERGGSNFWHPASGIPGSQTHGSQVLVLVFMWPQ